jgi:hypothetical protein
MHQILNQICNILYSEHLIYGLYMCICEFSLHRESFDVILFNTWHSMIGGVTLAPARA